MRRSQSSPHNIPTAAGDAYFDIPTRSSSSMSFFSDDSGGEEDSKKLWRFSTLKKKRVRRGDPLPITVFVTRRDSSFVLPPAQPLDLQLRLDFSGSAARASYQPPVRHSFDVAPSRHHRRKGSWTTIDTDRTSRTSCTTSRRSSSLSADWADAFTISSPRMSMSPDMMEIDEDSDEENEDVCPAVKTHSTPKAARVDHDEDLEILSFFAAPPPPRPHTPPLSALTSRPPRLWQPTSNESLIDPGLHALPGSPGSTPIFGLPFPLPPLSPSPFPSPQKALPTPPRLMGKVDRAPSPLPAIVFLDGDDLFFRAA
ncbi:hypothetical protein JCM10207_001776 [Rhodosporidiobolus poonsookiae]